MSKIKIKRSMKKILLLIICLTSLFSNTNINSFSKSKKILKKIYVNNQKTFYSNCDYSYKKKNKNMINSKRCGYVPKNKFTKKGKINRRARRIEWEHIVPAYEFARKFTCWEKGDIKCIKKSGKKYRGRKCCSKVSKTFKFMEADLHNLVPSIGELNAHRSNYKFSTIKGEKRDYGNTIDFEINFKKKTVEPKKDIRGNIARTYFYFEKTYSLQISKKQKKLLKKWNKEDKIDSWEKEKNKLVKNIQGNYNSFIY